jgi:hypothetical protein
MNLKAIASAIPDYAVYPTINEQYAATRQLAADFPDLVRVQMVGVTRSGEPIELISIGEAAAENVLAFAGAHPCEPIGCLTIDFLARYLCENPTLRTELGYQWHFIRCIDIDGMRLNEGWFKGPFTPRHYYRNMFRPLMPEQPEMLFPIEIGTIKFDRPMPETLALKAAIDLLRPRLMLSLHNAEFGGAYYYISQRLDSVFPLFAEIPGWFDIPLDLGESDQAGYIEHYAPAIYEIYSMKKGYAHRVAAGMQDPTSGVHWGAPSNEYAEELYGTTTLIIELPYWTEARINDDTPTNITRRQAFADMIDRQEVLFTQMKRLYARVAPDLTLNTPFRRAITDRVEHYLAAIPGQRRWLETGKDLDRAATVAEHFRTRYWKEHELLRMRGMFLRMLDAEAAAGNDSSAFFLPRELVKNNLHDVTVALAAALEYRTLPIRSLVSVQLCAGLATAQALRG